MDVEIRNALAGLRARDLMSHECLLVQGSMSVQDLVDHYILRTGRRCFMVMVLDRVAGLVTPNEIRALNREEWPHTPVQQIMKPLNRIRVVSPETPVTDVLEMMTKEDLNQVPVISDRGVEGMLARGEILQALKSRIELKKAS
jgi:predicted transcriptional regulator